MKGPIDQLKKLNHQKRILLDQQHSVNSRDMETLINQLNRRIATQQSVIAAQIDKMTPSQKYESKRSEIVQNIKSKDYWPAGMEHPNNYRGFYWTDDLAFCGFATLQHQQKTINMVQRAMNTSQG